MIPSLGNRPQLILIYNDLFFAIFMFFLIVTGEKMTDWLRKEDKTYCDMINICIYWKTVRFGRTLSPRASLAY